MKKPCVPGLTIDDRPRRSPKVSEPDETISEESPLGAGDGPQQTVVDGAPSPQFPLPAVTPRRPRAIGQPRPSVSGWPRAVRPSVRLTPVERNRVMAVTGAGIGLAALLIWIAPSGKAPLPIAGVPVRATASKAAIVEAPKPVVADAPRPTTDLHPPLFLEVPLEGGGTERRAGGRIKISSDPPTDVSIINGGSFGRTPTQVTAPVGKHQLVLENRELGVRRVLTIQMEPGLNASQTLEFGRGWLEVHAPPNSRVSIDGRPIGLAPVPQQSLFEGVHTVDVALADHTRDSRRVEVVPGLTVTHEVAGPLPP